MSHKQQITFTGKTIIDVNYFYASISSPGNWIWPNKREYWSCCYGIPAKCIKTSLLERQMEEELEKQIHVCLEEKNERRKGRKRSSKEDRGGALTEDEDHCQLCMWI